MKPKKINTIRPEPFRRTDKSCIEMAEYIAKEFCKIETPVEYVDFPDEIHTAVIHFADGKEIKSIGKMAVDLKMINTPSALIHARIT